MDTNMGWWPFKKRMPCPPLCPGSFHPVDFTGTHTSDIEDQSLTSLLSRGQRSWSNPHFPVSHLSWLPPWMVNGTQLVQRLGKRKWDLRNQSCLALLMSHSSKGRVGGKPRPCSKSWAGLWPAPRRASPPGFYTAAWWFLSWNLPTFSRRIDARTF